MYLDAFFEVMARWPIEVAREELLELVNPDLWQSDPLTAAELALRRSGRFDGEAYLRLHRDLAASRPDPYRHYVRYGIVEKRTFPVMGNIGKPKVSVILSCCDGQAGLDASLESLRRQILADLEIVIVHENPEGAESAQKLCRHVKNESRARYLQVGNTDHGNSLNMGLDYAAAPYVAFMEAGDIVDGEAYEVMYNECLEHDLDFIKSASELAEDEVVRPTITDDRFQDRILEPANDWYAWRAAPALGPGLYKVHFLRANGTRFEPAATFEESRMAFWYRIFLLADRFKFLSRPLYKHSMSKDGAAA